MIKQIPIAIAAVALMASAAHATFNVTVDVSTRLFDEYGMFLFDPITIDITLTTDGTHTVGPLGFYEYQASWDPDFLRVANVEPGTYPSGHSTQTLFPGMAGAEDPHCFNDGMSCVTISQFNATFNDFDTNGTVTGQLILEPIDIYSRVSDVLTVCIETSGAETADSCTVNIVPEPTTAALVALGLVGLGAARRRRE